jgi:hypothetical protein
MSSVRAMTAMAEAKWTQYPRCSRRNASTALLPLSEVPSPGARSEYWNVRSQSRSRTALS